VARKPRIDFPGVCVNVTTRGNNREPIQLDAVDCGIWERHVARAVAANGVEVYSYALLGNHFHILLHLPEGGLSYTMMLLNGGYAKAFNQRHARENHVFGQRFWSRVVTTREYMLNVLRYYAWNPVDAGLAATPEGYRWSAHGAILGLREAPSFLAVDAVLDLFHPDPGKARALYAEHVRNRRVPVPGTVTSL
jgi:REP element-mobilizing transposase RayT